MTQNRDLDPFTAEQLLSGAPVDGEVGPLADLLAAAAVPARADELMGEAAAAAAFRDAAGASRTAAAPAAFTGSRRALGLKVAITVAAVAGTGFAGTAAAGLLPGDESRAPVAAPTSATQTASSPAKGPGAETTTAPPQAGTGTGTPRNGDSPSGTASKPKTQQSETKSEDGPTSARPTVAVIAMCRTFSTMSRHDQGRNRYLDAIVDDPYFQPLVRAAGGKDKVAAYCKQVLEQTDHPSGRPTSDPTSRPAASETGNATTALPPPRGR
jgi:hypothetical protein